MISTDSSNLRTKHLRACSSPQNSIVDIGVTFVTQKSVALQLAAHQRLCLNGHFMLPWGREWYFFAFKQGIAIGPQIGMNPKPILGLPDLEY
jgi:hypothetical protein